MRWLALVVVAVVSVCSQRALAAAQAPDDPPLPPHSFTLKGERAERENFTAEERKVIAALKRRNARDLRSRRVAKKAEGALWKLRRTFQGKGDSERLKIKLFGNRHYRLRLYAAGLDGAEATGKMYDGSDEVVAAIVNIPSTEEIQSAKDRANAKAPLTNLGTRAPRTRSRRLGDGSGSVRQRALTVEEKAAWGLVMDLQMLQEGVPFAAKSGAYEIAVEANALWLLVLEQTSSRRRSVRQNRRSPGRYR